MNNIGTTIPESLQRIGLRVENYPAEQMPVDYLDQLVAKSRQPHIMQFESQEDTYGRFRNTDAYQEWAAGKERIFYLLLRSAMSGEEQVASDVGGAIWFSQKQHPLLDTGYNVTFSIRLYDEDQSRGWGKYVGRRLALPFMEAAHTAAAKYYSDKGVWLDLAAGNETAHHTYTNFGYVDLISCQGRVVMGNRIAFSGDLSL